MNEKETPEPQEPTPTAVDLAVTGLLLALIVLYSLPH